MKKYTILFYKGQAMEIDETQRNALLVAINDPNKKCTLLKDRTIMFGNIADINTSEKSFDDPVLDMPYNPNQIEEPKTYVQPETKKAMDEYMRKFQ